MTSAKTTAPAISNQDSDETNRRHVTAWLARHNGDREALAQDMKRTYGGSFRIQTIREYIALYAG